MVLRHLVAATLCLALVGVAGCDGDGGNAVQTQAGSFGTSAAETAGNAALGEVASGAAETTFGTPDAALSDTAAGPELEEVTPPEPEVAKPPPYAEGPFGLNKFEVIADLSFYDPATGEDVWLHDYYKDPELSIEVQEKGLTWRFNGHRS